MKLKKTWLTPKGRFRAHENGVPVPDDLFDILPSGSVVLKAPVGRENDVDVKGTPIRNKAKAAKVTAANAALARVMINDKLGKPVDPTRAMQPDPPQAQPVVSATLAEPIHAKARPAPEPRSPRGSKTAK
ncbi:MAG: hypothetical protein ABJN26_16070 [Stappiaceae bacterium]